jgi:hypothetical protein
MAEGNVISPLDMEQEKHKVTRTKLNKEEEYDEC